MHTYVRHRGAARDAAKLENWPAYLDTIDLEFRPPVPYTFIHRVTESIRTGDTWIAEGDVAPLGTITVDSTPDPGLWTPEELRRAYVIHRMITDRSASDRGVGKLMLDHADTLAQRDGREVLILDAWISNPDLHARILRITASRRLESWRTITRRVRPSSNAQSAPAENCPQT